MNTQIIILAAGHGKRMQSDIPKALTPLKGKPFVMHVLDSVYKSGVCENPIVVVGKHGNHVKGVLGDNYLYAFQEEMLGTGHAVMMAENLAKGKKEILVLYSDQPLVSAKTIKNLIDTHKNSDATITMATATVPDFLDWRQGFTNFGRFVRDTAGNIIRIVEVKDASDEEKMIKEVNPAFICFDADWMWKHLKELKNENAQGEYYLTDLIGMAFNQNKKIASIEIDPKEALGVNTKEQLEILENLI